MSSEPYALVVGVGEVYLAAVGTTFPDTDETPGASWTYLGSTDDEGVSVTHTRDKEIHFKGNSVLPQKATYSEARETIKFNLKEITVARYALVLDNAAVTSVAAGSGTPGTQYMLLKPGTNVPQFAMLVRGPSPVMDAFAQYEYARVSPTGEVETVYAKKDGLVLPCEFEAFEDLNNAGQFGTYRAQAAVAV